MKPAFALNLSHEGIGLLHRTRGGWIPVGEVALDTRDLGAAMAFLRTTALGLAPRGLATKLILPASQVLYTPVNAPAADERRRRAQIVAALEGLTPYDVGELVYDYSGTPPQLLVAVVARETLEEAEHFATEHRFNPVSFVAIPEEGQFLGEPFFGMPKSARALLGEDPVERDAEPVKILGPGLPARPEAPEPVAAPADAPAAEAVPEPEPEPAPEPEPEPRILRTSVTEPVVAEEEAPAPALTRPPMPHPEPGEASDPPRFAFASRRDTTLSPAAELAAAVAEPVLPPDTLALPAPRLTFLAAPAPDAPAPAAVVGAPAASRAAPQAGAPLAAPSAARSAPAAPAPAVGAAPAPGRRAPPPKPPAGRPGKPKPRGPAPRPGPAKPIARSAPGSAIPAPPPMEPPSDESEAMTLFGARQKASRRGPGGASAYLVILLSVLLLAALGAVALWSSIYLSGPNTQGSVAPPAEVASAPAPEAAPSPAAPAAQPDTAQPDTAQPEGAPNTTVDSAAVAALQDSAATVPGPDGSLPAAQPDLPAPAALAPPAAAAHPAAPDAPSTIALAAIDPHLAAGPGPALPVPGPLPAPPAAPAAPAASAPAPEAPAPAASEAAAVPASTEPAPSGRNLGEVAALSRLRPLPRPTTGIFAAPAPAPAAPPAQPPAETAAGAADSAAPAVLNLRPAQRPTTGVFADPTPPATQGDAPAAAPIVTLARLTMPRPQNRPNIPVPGLSSAVASAIAAVPAAPAPAAPAPQPQVASVAPVPAMPAMPANPSVAKEATVKGALNLNRINLLGVFGTSQNRTALVRMPSGAVKRVQVGDTLDGGRVAAIGEDSLYYVKGGQNIQLAMPKG